MKDYRTCNECFATVHRTVTGWHLQWHRVNGHARSPMAANSYVSSTGVAKDSFRDHENPDTQEDA